MSDILEALGGKVSEVFSPVTEFFSFFKLFMLKIEIFGVNIAFVIVWFLTIFIILSFVTFPFWFPVLMKKYKGKTIGKFLDASLTGLVAFFK